MQWLGCWRRRASALFWVRLEKEREFGLSLVEGGGRGAEGGRNAVLAAGPRIIIRAQCGSAHHSCVGPVEAEEKVEKTTLPRSPRNDPLIDSAEGTEGEEG